MRSRFTAALLTLLLAAGATPGTPAVADPDRKPAAVHFTVKQRAGDYFTKRFTVKVTPRDSSYKYAPITLDGRRGKPQWWNHGLHEFNRIPIGRHTLRQTFNPKVLPATVQYGHRDLDRCHTVGTRTHPYITEFTYGPSEADTILAAYRRAWDLSDGTYYYIDAQIQVVIVPASRVISIEGGDYVEVPASDTTADLFKIRWSATRFVGKVDCSFAGLAIYQAPIDRTFDPRYDWLRIPKSTLLRLVHRPKPWVVKRVIHVVRKNGSDVTVREAKAIHLGDSQERVRRVFGTGGALRLRAHGVSVRSYGGWVVIGYVNGRVDSIQRL